MLKNLQKWFPNQPSLHPHYDIHGNLHGNLGQFLEMNSMVTSHRLKGNSKRANHV